MPMQNACIGGSVAGYHSDIWDFVVMSISPELGLLFYDDKNY